MKMKKFRVPPYYFNKAKHNEIKDEMRDAAYEVFKATLDFVTGADTSKVVDTLKVVELEKKVLRFREAYGHPARRPFDDTDLVIVTRGFPFLEALLILKRSRQGYRVYPCMKSMTSWVDKVFTPAAKRLHSRWWHKHSNHGAWGLAGHLMVACLRKSGMELQDYRNLNLIKSQLRRADSRQQPKWLRLLFGDYRTGGATFWAENMRTNSGLYYMHYRLAAYLKVAPCLADHLLDELTKELEPYMVSYDGYCYGEHNGDKPWLFRKTTKIPGLKQLHQLFFPSGDTFRPYWIDGKMAALLHVWEHITGKKPSPPVQIPEDYSFFPYPYLQRVLEEGHIPTLQEK
jgi:hypothetical protein